MPVAGRGVSGTFSGSASSRTAKPPGATASLGWSGSPRWWRNVGGTLPGVSVRARTNSSAGFFLLMAADVVLMRGDLREDDVREQLCPAAHVPHVSHVLPVVQPHDGEPSHPDVPTSDFNVHGDGCMSGAPPFSSIVA